MKRLLTVVLAMSILFTMTACYASEFEVTVDQYAVTLPGDFVPETEGPEDLPDQITFKKLTVIECDDYDIKISGIIPDTADGYVINISLSNNTEQTETTKTTYIYETDDEGSKYIVGEETVKEYTGLTYLFAVDSVVVNGKEMEASFSADVAAEESAFDQILLSKEALEGLGTITEIELLFKVYVSRDEDVLIAEIGTTIYPYGNLEE